METTKNPSYTPGLLYIAIKLVINVIENIVIVNIHAE